MTPKLADLMVDRRSRARACELAIIAHALLDPGSVRFRDAIFVSREAALVLDAIVDQPETARVALVATVQVAARCRRNVDRIAVETMREAGRLAREAETVTIMDLAAAGSLDIVVMLLADAQAHPARIRVVA